MTKFSELGLRAKNVLTEFVPEIDKRLIEIWDKESFRYFGFNETQKAIAREMITHARSHNLAPSKRIRSAFVINSFKLSGNQVSEDIWRAAAAVELVHTALLMHDDFMDEDLVRRGMETTNAVFSKKYGRHYGDVMAVNIGDMTLVLGFETLLKSSIDKDRVVEAVVHMQRTIFNTAIGQAHDATLGHLKDWGEQDVMAVHMAKTGYYTYENPLMVGAILAGLSDDVKEILKTYSEYGGVAFQLQDDILGVFGDMEKTGKSSDSDLLQGKATLLIHGVMKFGTEQQIDSIIRVWGKKKAKREDLILAKKAIVESGSLEYNKNKAKEMAIKAVESAKELRKHKLDEVAVSFIQGVAEYMVEREV